MVGRRLGRGRALVCVGIEGACGLGLCYRAVVLAMDRTRHDRPWGEILPASWENSASLVHRQEFQGLYVLCKRARWRDGVYGGATTTTSNTEPDQERVEASLPSHTRAVVSIGAFSQRELRRRVDAKRFAPAIFHPVLT